MLCTLGAIVAPQFAPATQDPRSTAIASDLAFLQSRIDRSRLLSGDHQYPDLVRLGWAPLIDLGLLEAAPVNRLNGSSDVGLVPASGLGWCYDRASGKVFACYFDERTGMVKSDEP
jgi:hypothetical protein